jgi:SIR2-like domain
MIPTDQLTTFERTLRAGHYSLLFGAGVSTDSSNVLGQNIQGADQFCKALCSRYSLDPHTPLHEAAELLVSASDREQLLIKPFTCQTAGRTLEYLFQFCWRRIYTLNFDDVVEKLHKQCLSSEIKPKQQKLVTFHFNDPSVPEHSDDELQLVHLHGTVRKPDAPIVLTWSQYGEITRSLNGWMTQLRRLAKITWSIISIEVKLYSSTHHEICVS